MGNQRNPARSAIVAQAIRFEGAGRFTFWPS
jgi:hypothetical protein